MSIFSFFFGGPKKDDAQRMQEAARGQSVVGNVFGSSPYMREWRSMHKEVIEQHKKQEKALRKQWRREDEHIQRSFDKEKARYARNMSEKDAARFYAKWETDHRREIQRKRDRVLEDMERKKHEQTRNIGPRIREFK